MRPALALTVLLASLLAGVVPAAADTPAGPVPIAPVMRASRHFELGAAYLKQLPEGSRVRVERADGAKFTFTLERGTLRVELPASAIGEDRALLTTPLGYVLGMRDADPNPGAFRIETPSGAWTALQVLGKGPALRSLIASTRGRKVWSTRFQDTYVLRLPDGTRVDTIDAGAHWEALTLRGERFRLDTRARTWTALDPLPSPPLIPDTDTVYVTRDGETWRRPLREEHVVFAWNWYPAGLSLAQAIADVETGPRRKDLDRYFVEIADEQPPADEAGYVLGRRLALSGGDQVVFERPGAPPDRVFLLPASIDVAGADLKNELINSTTINIPSRTTGKPRE